jgi:hypothetical protein
MKILCLGNNTEDTDVRTKELAHDAGYQCHGLLSELDGPVDVVKADGYYHSSVYDIEFGRLLEIAEWFDQVIVLAQPKSEYSHPNAFYQTVKVASTIRQHRPVVFLDQNADKEINFFEQLVNDNKSFCIFPFIELLTINGNTTVCCRSSRPITTLSKLENYATDSNYRAIRDKMIAGELVPEHCSACYNLESQGITSARQFETVEWANRLNLTSLDDLATITAPVYYEVRPSNVCNLQCRMCNPYSSNLIAREYKKINLVSELVESEYTNFDFIDFTSLQKLYVAGGEPTAMIEFYDFLDKCIEAQQTNFEFLVNTNATKINGRFQRQLQHFSNMQFIVSIDGLDKLNYYIRWPSNWANIIQNVHYLEQQHKITFNTTVSIYNVYTLYHLLSFFDSEFSGIPVHCQLAGSDNDMLSAFNFPNRELCLNNLIPIRQLRCYKNDPLLQSFIEGLITHYQTPTVDLAKLKLFFEFNDLLDQSRNVKLVDYIPELEKGRALL